MAKLRVSDLLKLPDGFHADENGLYLYVRGNSRTWVYRSTVDGKRIKRGLGSIKDVTLAQARSKAAELRAKPLRVNKRREKSFVDFYLEAIDHIEKVKKWKDPKNKTKWIASIRNDIVPVIGNMKVGEIRTADIVRALEPIYYKKTETASRIIGRLRAIFDYAQVCGERTAPNPSIWDGCLDNYFPSRSKVAPVKHLKSVPWQNIPAVCKAVWEIESVGAMSVLFGILTASRVNEFALAEWQEIDWENDIWIMPAGRRKDQKLFPHRVPLNKQIKMVLDRLPTRIGFLFPSISGNTHINKETPRKVLKDLGLDVTMHGMRSSFRDWAAETGQDWAASEKALSHAVGSEVTQAYLRTDMLEKRREIMQAWADWCFSEICR